MAKFFRRGTSKIYFLPVVAAYSGASGVGSGSPTTSEMNAGTDLSNSLSALTGFQLTNSSINTPDLGSTFVKNITGEDTTAASSLTFYDDTTATAIRTLLLKGQEGYIVLCPYGRITSKRCEVWPVRSAGVNDTWDTGNEAAKFMCSFAVQDVPNQSGTLP
jgi:hypothetical protein